MGIVEFVLSILFPKICLRCGKIGLYYCATCRVDLEKLVRTDTLCPVCTRNAVGGVTHPYCRSSLSPDGLLSVYPYQDAIRSGIKRIKYRGSYALVDELMHSTVLSLEKKRSVYYSFFDFVTKRPVLVPVPIHKKRMNIRGFNQSELIAEKFAQHFCLRMIPDVLIRTVFHKPQAGLSKSQRKENIRDSFAFNPKYKNQLQYSPILLIDDVWTTGATMREAVKVLKRNGIKPVWCLTIAR